MLSPLFETPHIDFESGVMPPHGSKKEKTTNSQI